MPSSAADKEQRERWLTSHWRPAAAIAGTTITAALVVATHPGASLGSQLFTLASSIALGLLLLRPGLGAGLAVATLAVDQLSGHPAGWSLFTAVVCLHVVLRSPRRRGPWLLAGAVAVAAGLPGPLMRREADVWNTVLGEVLLFTVAALAGEVARRRREKIDALQERSVVLERLRRLETEAAAEAERARMARELHDVLAHAVSAMVLHAGAGRRALYRRPADAEAALTTIETTGRQAMDDLRHVFGVVRRAEAAAADHTLREVGALIDSAGLPVRLVHEGEALALPPAVDLTAYRIVQEALTNVRRHALDVTTVEVAISWTPDALTIEVHDDGRPSPTRPSETSSGQGLIGMRERVRLTGGALHTGPHPEGHGWLVRATLPLGPGLAEGAS